MKRFFLNLLCVCLLAIGLAGCNSSVDTVKDGMLSFDKSTTIGNAFDNYSCFKKTSWKEIHTKQKQVVVEFEGIFDLSKFFTDYNCVIDFMTNKKNREDFSKEQKRAMDNDLNKIMKCNVEDVEGLREEMLSSNMGEHLKRTKEFHKINSSVIIQFKINKDDTFEINYMGVTIEGKEYTYSNLDDIVNIYGDKPMDVMACVLYAKL